MTTSRIRAAALGPQSTCGIELELILSPKANLSQKFATLLHDPAYANTPPWVKFAAIHNGIRPNAPPMLAEDTQEFRDAEAAGTRYKSWTCVKDGSLRCRPEEWPIEIVSPVFKPSRARFNLNPFQSQSEPWVNELREVWSIITENFNLIFSTTASSHVHVKRLGTGQTQYTLPDLQNICKSIVVWQSVVELCVPDARTNPSNRFCINNLTRPIADRPLPRAAPEQWLLPEDYALIRQKTFAPIFGKIDSFRDPGDLITYIGQDKFLAWNFSYVLVSNSIGTIEFRLPPMCNSETDSLFWISFAVSFINAAVTCDSNYWRQYATGQYPPDISWFSHFQTMMNQGATSANLKVDQYLIFKNPMYVRQRNFDPRPPPPSVQAYLGAAPPIAPASGLDPLTFGAPGGRGSNRSSSSSTGSMLGRAAYAAGGALAGSAPVQNMARNAATGIIGPAVRGAASGMFSPYASSSSANR